jgi:hypothetical protein
MGFDISVPRSRRALISGALAGLAASAAQALGRPGAAAATDGFAVIQGADNSGSASTLVRSNTTTAFQGLADATSGTAYGVRGRSNSTAGAGVVGQVVAVSGLNYGVRGLTSSGAGAGVRGEGPSLGVDGYAAATSGGTQGVFGHVASPTGFGVYGISQWRGVQGVGTGASGIGTVGLNTGSLTTGRGVLGYASAGTGVHGWSGSLLSIPAGVATTGVLGECNKDTVSNGVLGRSAAGYGVHGTTTSGTGLYGEAATTSGAGLRVRGKAIFSRSGKATVAAGASSVVVAGLASTASTFVVATIQGAGASGLYVRNVSVNTAASTITIVLSKAVAVNTSVGWFVGS